MKSRRFYLLAVMPLLCLVGCAKSEKGLERAIEVSQQPFEVWSVYEGSLESRHVQHIMSGLGGPATIVDMAPEGTRVKKGDVLVRFDSSQIERDVLKLERDHALARAELESLENAKLPLELRDLETRLADARSVFESERQYLEDSRQLLAEELVSEQEIVQQETKVAAAASTVRTLEMQLDLTGKYLHPSALERARSTLDAAGQELAMARKQLSNTVVVAPVDGLVAYRPVHVSGEFRTARVGDTIYRNQPFMALPDMDCPIVRCNVPEAELSKVGIGSKVFVTPLAYPDIRINGSVESVGTMAQSVTGRPDWQRFFSVTIGLDQADPRLRPGMSVRMHVLSYSKPEAVLVPRVAVRWDKGAAYCMVSEGARQARREIELGMANEQHYEVLSGLRAGEKVIAP